MYQAIQGNRRSQVNHDVDKMIPEDVLAVQQMVENKSQVDKLSWAGCEGARPEQALFCNAEVIKVKGTVQRIEISGYAGQQDYGYLDKEGDTHIAAA
jgi:hypothetical protein